MDDIQETELHEATTGLGNWHNVGDKAQYLANKEECLSCLKDLHIALKHDSPEAGHMVHLKLGEWKVLPNHLVPLFTSYREDPEISSSVLKVLVQLTTRCELFGAEQLRHLEHLQDYKEAFGKKDVFIILMGMLVENMEEDEAEDRAPGGSGIDVFGSVLSLLRNLVSVPDPSPGDAGFTPMRRQLQLVYIRHFHDEGVLDFFLLFAEGLAAEQDSDKKAWALADIIYHMCTHVDPEQLTQGSKEKDKSILRDLIEREQADTRLRAPVSSRHSRFGTAIVTRTAQGGSSISTSVMETANISKGGTLWRREFHDPHARSEKKQNMFHDPFFVDLEEGSVRDHNQLNTHIRNSLESAKTLGGDLTAGLKKFFEEFMQTSFSSLVHTLRSTLGNPSTTSAAHLAAGLGPRGQPAERPGGPFDRPKLLNFLAWFLEFHRYQYAAAVSQAKKAKEATPVIDIASIQGAIDLDMIQFTASRLREYGKDSNMHVSLLVMTLRALTQQVKTIDTVVDSKDQDTRDCGEILTQNIIKDNVLSQLTWVMKNFKSSSHDPRIISYAVEVFHYMLRLMRILSERKGQKLEFQVELTTSRTLKRSTTTMEQEIAGLASALVIENLFHLLEKYKRLSSQLLSMLVKLIYQVIRVRRENIVIFFELSYFVRIQRIYADPLVRDKKAGKRFHEMVELLKFILRQFFKCAEANSCVFVELLFRKVPESTKDSLLGEHTAEFAAILDNYDNEEYARVLEKMRAGETLNALKTRQRALLEGTLPWTDEEDEILRTRFHIYAEHPLCAELLAAELPEESQRTGVKVRKRLIELGLIVSGQRGAGARNQAAAPRPDNQLQDATKAGGGGADDPFEPPSKKPRLDTNTTNGDGAAESQIDETLLETDLERLLDAAMEEDSFSQLFTQTDAAAPAPAAAAEVPSGSGPSRDGMGGGAEEANLLDLETALEAELDAALFEPELATPGVAAAAPVEPALPGSIEVANAGGGVGAADTRDRTKLGAERAMAQASASSRLSSSGCSMSWAAPEADEFDLERALESQLDADLGMEVPACAETSEPVTVLQAPSADGPSGTAEFDLERALESQLDKELGTESPAVAGTGGQASQGSEGGFDLEQALGSQLDRDPEFLAGIAKLPSQGMEG
mmetsp:Transcript_127390/g.318003  ORF Transcript_127390/g.318003 Transcript_127390/m.318003 type:complete len:1141 (+) Transcript_127390:68-3490(+)|eukprot:CAMPEP_0115411234 /NCGR_PEP_ID=MMETSP0271-20121206/20928_1 /TAXON_ID=71861 /ORGANISM="Scrippsiella trochoidea, Strain CCMP3099" /LENGTH=1140 /DNA_ID=CAMNT_0002835433 /DNA_START=58 /DNA_END=3480 /DNA_ORIENTATION=-